MEFTWRMVSTIAWPVAVVVIVLAFRRWIFERVDSLGIKFGTLDVQLKTLNDKVDQVGQDISITLSDNMPRPSDDGIPVSLVDLMATVSKNRIEGVRAAFDLVYRALKENYPKLRRVLPSQLSEAMRDLVTSGEMEPDVASSVQQLYELLVMSEWEREDADGTHGYAFLMLAEGAIHGILRSSQARSVEPGDHPLGDPQTRIGTSWVGTYNGSLAIQLSVATQTGSSFDGTMTYPDADTVTRVAGTIDVDGDDLRLSWKELDYVRNGHHSIDFGGYYAATVKNGDTMNGAWYQADRLVARFTMTPFDGRTAPESSAKVA